MSEVKRDVWSTQFVPEEAAGPSLQDVSRFQEKCDVRLDDENEKLGKFKCMKM